MHIKDWPEGDRPREMLLEKGPEALSDAALPAILLRTGRQGKNAIALAREMINRFGGLNGLMMATQEDLLSVKGIGNAKMAQILAAMEIVKRRLRQPLEKINIIENPSDLFEYLKASMSNLSREEFRLLHLNRSKHLIAEEVLFRGTVDESAVYAREVVESALRKRASALIFVHNHPTGPAESSLEDFDRVITNPPFSQNYSKDGMKFTERFKVFCPEKGKKGDLMFLQHMLAVLRTNGMMATVMPHGVLFRGGAEKEIRKGVIEDDLLEAVIGFPPNLFYGTGIPACVLVCRAKGAKPDKRKDKVLFINADAEFHAGRAQNYLRPEHIEKITSAFDAFENIPGYAVVVTREDIKSNDWNLNIRRYADNAPPPEPHDVRAHLLGGIPKAEVEAKKELLDAHGLKISTIFMERDADYYDFDPALIERGDIKKRIETGKGIQLKEIKLKNTFDQWWEKHRQSLIDLSDTGNLMEVRTDLLEAFVSDITPVGLLDRFKVAGVIATWWNENKFDLKTLIAQGFGGLVDGWVDTIEAVMEETKGNHFDLADDPLVTRLIPDYLKELEHARQDIVRLDQEKAFQPHAGITNQLKEARKRLKELQKQFIKHLHEARELLSDDDCRDLVLDIINEKLASHLESYVTAHRQEVVTAVENWWDKYRVTLRDIEGKRETAAKKLDEITEGLGYGCRSNGNSSS